MRAQTRAWLLGLVSETRRAALAGRLLRWLGCYLGVRALALAAGRLGLLSEAAFGAIDLGLLSLLPAFAAFPARRGLSERALRTEDSGRLLESLQAARGKAALPLIDAEADAYFTERSLLVRPKARSESSARAIALGGAALLAAYQLFLLAAGEGPRLGFAPPERSRAPIRLAAEPGRFEAPQEAPASAQAFAGEEKAAAPEPEARAPGSMSNEEAARLLRERLERSEGAGGAGASEAEGGPPEPEAEAPGDQAGAPGEGAASGSGSGATEGANTEGSNGSDGSGADPRGDPEADEADPEGGSSGAPAGETGWEGSGRSLEASPLLDYKARFERLYHERTGERLSALGSGASLSPELAAEALRHAYASLALRVVLEADDDAISRSLRDSWRALREAAR